MMDNVSASDTMVFEKDGLWWMLTNLNPEGGSDHCSELYLFYSENVMDSQWVSHPNNPIYIDPLIARNGGILFDDDQILGYVNDRDLINMDMKVGFIELQK